MRWPLQWVAKQLGLSVDSETQVSGWSIDSGTVQPGDLFFALRGPNHDAHSYVAEVLRKGAVAAIVDRNIATDGITLRVDDTLAALQQLAREARAARRAEVIAVTGSAGKTTT